MAAPGEPEQEEGTSPEETYADVFDCGALEVSCHITQWFHELVVGILEPLLSWAAGKLFTTPGPTAGVTGVWESVSATVNILYVLFVLAAGFVVMAHHSLQAQYGAREVLPRLVVGFVASNVSLSVASLSAEVSTALAQAVSDDGINPDVAAWNLSRQTTPFLADEATAVVLFLLVFVILLVLWVIVEIVRIVIVILLMVGGPLMLMFHALPQTNRVAQMWWRALGAVCLVPIAQAVAFTALMRVFFEGDTQALFGVIDIMSGEANLFDLFLLLVLVYVQIRIPFWAYRAVWSPPTGTSPAVGIAKSLTWVLAMGAATVATGGGAALGTAAGSASGRAGTLLRAVRRRQHTPTNTANLPRRARTWRFGSPGPTHNQQTRSSKTTVRSAQNPGHTSGQGRGGPVSTATPRTPRSTSAPAAERLPGRHGKPSRQGPNHPSGPTPSGRTGDSRVPASHRQNPLPYRDTAGDERGRRRSSERRGPVVRPVRERRTPTHRRPAPNRHRWWQWKRRRS